MITVKLKKNRQKSLERKHPWVFSGAIDQIKEMPRNGETVKVISSDGKFLGWAAYSTKSQISLRIWSFKETEIINSTFFKEKILQSIELRKQILDISNTNVYRLINAESDSLPGMIVDKYNDFIVCQFLSAGAEFWKQEIVNELSALLNPSGIYERSDVEVREKEGLDPVSGILFGEAPPDFVEIIENGIKFFVDIKNGHKTGFYIDQRDNRKLIENYSSEKEILNCFSYTGGFSAYAIKGGAVKITNVDSSLDALSLAEKNLLLNSIDSSKYENVVGDVFKYLRKLRDANKHFDIIILDPPKFAESASQVEKAGRGYKDINLLAIKLLNTNGLLVTFSCSGHITTDLFSKIISDAALDSGKTVHIIKHLTQSSDHTMLTSFPESLYLKGLICKVN
ncbi:MAG: class I SAM-dependent methyltransferase [Ignavibacteriaceae bacterium]|jgi:23S rRNA (cytosine1962-C5)-methyltransferase